MELDVFTQKGTDGRPVVVFIHGLGMDKNIWLDPLNTRIFARNIPLRVFAATKPCLYSPDSSKKVSLGDIPKKVNSLWDVLGDAGFNLVCWSQKRPVGPMSSAVEELSEVIKRTKRRFPKTPLVIIGHSRGGLIARKFMERKTPGINALITISTPHRGSNIAKLEKYIRPFSSILKGVLPKDTHGVALSVVKNVSELLNGNALKELLPDSAFFRELRDFSQQNVKYISFGGTEPRLFTIYIWKKKGKGYVPRSLMAVPDSLVKITPSFFVMNELNPGKGDGLVSAESSLLPWAAKHYNIGANHVSIIWDRRVIKTTLKLLEAI